MLMTLKRQSSQKRKLLVATRAAFAHVPDHIPPVLFLTDPGRTPDPVSIAAQLPPGWGVIYRHFGAEDARKTAVALADVCRTRKLRLLISADPALAIDVDADGVHWPHHRITCSRKWQNRFALMTASAHSAAELRSIMRYPVDAALLSTVFASNSPSARAPIGALRFRQITRVTPVPVFALGGVTAANASRVASFAGIAGIDSIAHAFSM